MNSLAPLWLKGECPILNGVMFADGFVQCVEPCEQPRPLGIITLVAKERTPIEQHTPFETTGLIRLCRAEDQRRGLVVIGGEAGMGSDGFVALTDTSNQLRWIAFFDFSNPFVSVKLFSDKVIGENNLAETWRFSLENPSQIQVNVPALPMR
jgi:hypothetical protein